MVVKILAFLFLNFGALAVGGLFTSTGVSSNWYASLDKAPWTPPGWMFGLAWTIIMTTFAFYMAYVWKQADSKKKLIVLYLFQLVLNVFWSPLFFHFHHVGFALLTIGTLTFLIGFFFCYYWGYLRYKSLLILPYLIWLIIATSLNGYIFLQN